MKPYQEKVLQEKRELDEKITKLQAFINGDAFPLLNSAEKDRMQGQLWAMRVYSFILGQRIVNFKP